MSVETIIRAEFEQVAREHHRPLATFDDDMVLLESGLDSLCFAVIMARLHAQLGIDPFATSEPVWFPVTLRDFIKFYQDAAA